MHSKIGPMWQNQPLRLCTASVHNTTQNSSDNLPFYQTSIIARMLSIGGETKTRVKNKRNVTNIVADTTIQSSKNPNYLLNHQNLKPTRYSNDN